MTTVGSRMVSVPAGRLPRWIENFAVRHGVPRATSAGDALLLVSPDGASARLRLRWDEPVDPSDPVTSFLTSAARPRRLGLLAIRRARHAVGLWQGGLLEARAGRHYVQGRTKAGGWSQQRYARRRDNQARKAFEDAADDAADLLDPVADSLERLVVAGDAGGIDAVLADPRCRRLAALAARHPGPRLEIKDPTRTALADLAERWASAQVELNELA